MPWAFGSTPTSGRYTIPRDDWIQPVSSAPVPCWTSGYAVFMGESDSHVEKIRQQFTRQADAYSQMQQTRDEQGLRLLVALAGVSSSDRVVDVACGPGFLTMAFAEKCENALGVDATDELLKLARREAAQRKLGNVEFVLGDASQLALPGQSFDVASCRAAFHHFPDPAGVLREMREIEYGCATYVHSAVRSSDICRDRLFGRFHRSLFQ